MNSVTKIDKLCVTRLTSEQRTLTCGYWFTVTSGSMPHTAFDTLDGLRRWADERGLQLPSDLSNSGCQPIDGEYYRVSHLCDDPGEVENMQGLATRTLSNGDYVVAIITCDDYGIRTVHTLNPNVRARKVFDYQESRVMMGGHSTSR